MNEFPECVRSRDSIVPSESSRVATITWEDDDDEDDYIENEDDIKPKKPKRKRVRESQLIVPGSHEETWGFLKQQIINTHRVIDYSPPFYNILNGTGMLNLRLDIQQFGSRVKSNLELLVALMVIRRTHGDVMPFTCDKVYTSTSLPVALRRLDAIELKNFELGKRFLDVVTDIDTGRKQMCLPKVDYKMKRLKINPKILARYQDYNIRIPKTNLERWLLFRPRVYFEVFLKDSRPLGNIVAQLYTEAAPAVVLDIVRYCMAQKHRRFEIKRLFPNLWIDVKMPVSTDSFLRDPTMEYDAKVVDHGKSKCVLSFSKDYLKGCGDSLTFSISYRPLKVANGSRIGFGRIISGSRIFDCLQSYGTKNGKLSRGIMITRCGCL